MNGLRQNARKGERSSLAPPLERGMGGDCGTAGGPLFSAVRRAAVYRLLATGFSLPDDDEAAFEEARETFGALEDRELEAMAMKLKHESAGRHGSRAEQHARLFGFGTGGDFSLYETEHVGHEIFRKSRDLADIAGFYRAFGLELGGEDRERVDHLSVEAEFLSWLCLKQSVAISEGLPEKAAICREAEFKFLKDHFLRWVPGLVRKIEEGSEGFYQILAHFTGSWLDRVMVDTHEARDGDDPSVIPVKTGIQTGCPPHARDGTGPRNVAAPRTARHGPWPSRA